MSSLKTSSYYIALLLQNNLKVTQKLQEHVLAQLRIQTGLPVRLNTDLESHCLGCMYKLFDITTYKKSFTTGLSIPHSCERKLGRRRRGRKGRKGGVEGRGNLEKTRVSYASSSMLL